LGVSEKGMHNVARAGQDLALFSRMFLRIRKDIDRFHLFPISADEEPDAPFCTAAASGNELGICAGNMPGFKFFENPFEYLAGFSDPSPSPLRPRQKRHSPALFRLTLWVNTPNPPAFQAAIRSL